MELRIHLSSLSPPSGSLRAVGAPVGSSSPDRYFTGWLELLKVLDEMFAGNEEPS